MTQSGVVYVLNEKNEIIQEFNCDFSDAIMTYHGHRDLRGNRYYVMVRGKKPPFKHKQKELRDVIVGQRGRSENIGPEPTF